MIPSKANAEGYKVWCVCDSGYIIDFMWHGRSAGPVGINQQYLKEGYTPPQAAVLTLIRRNWLLYRRRTFDFDNLFTSRGLLEKLYGWQIGGCGTVRTKATKAELLAEGYDKLGADIIIGSNQEAVSVSILRSAWVI
jgi:hypothetical protein